MYDWLAPLYDLGVWFLSLFLGGEEGLRGKVIDELGPSKGMTVLEMFCGTATLSIMAARLEAKVTALDLSEGMLKVAREKAERAGVKVLFARGRGEALPLTGASFDRVMISMGLHEVPAADSISALHEAHRVLKDGGRLVIFDYSRAEGAASVIQKLFFTFVEGDTAGAWVRMDLQEALGSIGFRDFKRRFLFKRALQLLTVVKR